MFEFVKYDVEDFCDIIRAREGWAVGEQAEAIFLKDEPLEKQNTNALRIIADLAKYKGEPLIHKAIEDYLNNVQEN